MIYDINETSLLPTDWLNIDAILDANYVLAFHSKSQQRCTHAYIQILMNRMDIHASTDQQPLVYRHRSLLILPHKWSMLFLSVKCSFSFGMNYTFIFMCIVMPG